MRSELAGAFVVLFAAATVAESATERHGCIVRTLDPHGKPVRFAALEPRNPLADPNHLTFTFNSPQEPWSSYELDSLQTALSRIVPALEALCGPPLSSDQVNIVKDSSLLNDGVAGTYSPSSHVVTLYGSHPVVLCHELAHAFHGEASIDDDGFEEGMARAVEIAVSQQFPTYPLWGPHHSAPESVNYEILNQPSVSPASGHFWSGFAGVNLRYELAGYVWGKVEIEHPGFLRDFDQAYYDRFRIDPSLEDSIAVLRGLAGQFAPTVEGQPFAIWANRQYVLGITPQLGVQLYQYLPAGGIALFERIAGGAETLIAGHPVDWRAIDADDVVVGEGTSITDPQGFVHPNFPLPPFSSRGRLRIEATATTAQGTATSIAYRPVAPGAGLFGLVIGGEEGTVTVTRLDSAMAPVMVPARLGQFEAPGLEKIAGRFEVRYTDPAGRQSTRIVTKDASRYLVLLSAPAGPPGAAAVLAARPSVTRQRCRFTLDRSLSGPGWLTLYDVGGRIVRVLAIPEGSRSMDWDGADASGLAASSGVLVARLVAPGVDARTRVVITR